LSAILMMVGWNMGEWRAFAQLGQFRRPYRITFLAVFGFTVLVDLSTAVQVGLALAMITFIYRISELTRIQAVSAMEMNSLMAKADREAFPSAPKEDAPIHCHRLVGVLFFGAVQLLETMATSLAGGTLILDFEGVLYMDSSGLDALMELSRSCQAQGTRLIVCSLSHQPRDILLRLGPKYHASQLATLEQHNTLTDALAGMARH
jgi:SulP family sulfate permease